MKTSLFAAALLFAASPVVAQTFERGWIDVNLGISLPAEKETLPTLFSNTIFQEIATFQAEYADWKTGASFDVGGGFMFSPNVGAGVSFSGNGYTTTAALSARIPHPTRFNLYGTGTGSTEDDLVRSEGAINLHVMIAQDVSPRVRVRVFGGPSFFRLRQDFIREIRYTQTTTLTTNTITITGYDTERLEFDEATGWGFHVGGDVSWFFHRVVGIGGYGKYSRGTVETDSLVGTQGEYRVGGVQAGGGLRLRF